MAPRVIRLIEEIRNNRTRGAVELARQAVQVLKIAAEVSLSTEVAVFLDEIREVGKSLISARPAMAPVRNAVNRIMGEIHSQAPTVESLRQYIILRADNLINESLQAVALITKYAAELVHEDDIILTHSYSSTVVAAFKEISSRHGKFGLIVTKSGPGRTGEEIVRQMEGSNASITFIDDAALGLYMPEVDRLLLGADTIGPGMLVNGVGSYPLVTMADRHGVPVFVLADTLKFDATLSKEGVDIEDRDVIELVDPECLPKGIDIKNPHFDVTPLELVNGIVTEQGIMTPGQVTAYLKDLATS